ncbi:MAG: glucodextranase DOMON-like domain-containing protein, partial [Spirochaetales bacterium]
IYEEKFGRQPVGLWPAEGSVAQEIVKMVGDAGYQWMASGEQVLAKSLGLESFVRDASDTVTDADALYRPYIVQPRRGEPVTIVFRDLRLSDLIGFEYSGTDGEAAAEDFMRRLENIRQRLRETAPDAGPHLVSVILDGENAWEHYPNDGKAFLNALYRMLSESETIETTTVPAYMERFPEQRTIDDLWPGSWFSSDYSTWIGEPEETKAWNLLGRVREFLALYDMGGRRTTSHEQLALAQDYMYLAEGSDWFWWYGADQDSGQDEYFDVAYRELLSNVFRALGEPVPDYLRVPIIPERVAPPSRRPSDTFTPTVDGQRSDEEWAAAGYYQNTGSAQARASDVLDRVDYGFDTQRMHLFVQTAAPLEEVTTRGAVQLYFGYPGQLADAPFVNAPGQSLIGFDASAYIEITSQGATLFRRSQDDSWEQAAVDVVASIRGRSAELSLLLETFGDLESGDEISFRAFFVEQAGATDLLPSTGPGQTNIPDLGGGELVLSIEDPEGDDHGPGSYEYPSDTVFGPGVYDITSFSVEDEEEYLKFTVGLRGAIQNPWNSPINLSVQTVDIYLDIDPGTGTGARKLLEGRNAALPADAGWEFALWVEGWNQKVLTPLDPGDPASAPAEMSGSPLRVRVDADSGRLIIRMPKSLLPSGVDPSEMGYTVVVLSQEGFPSAGVRRVRNVARTAGQWVIGGAPAESVHHTRIMDMVVPSSADVSQEELLSDYAVSAGGGSAALAPDDLPRAHVIRP